MNFNVLFLLSLNLSIKLIQTFSFIILQYIYIQMYHYNSIQYNVYLNLSVVIVYLTTRNFTYHQFYIRCSSNNKYSIEYISVSFIEYLLIIYSWFSHFHSRLVWKFPVVFHSLVPKDDLWSDKSMSDFEYVVLTGK